MPWTFSINEVSAGHFIATAKRHTGQTISKDGSDDVIPDLIQDAYRAEVTTGALDSKAAYEITLDFLGVREWEGRYHERAFGSWSILSRSDSMRAVHFDGRDFYVMVSREARGYSWQGALSELEKGRCHYFREIATL
jgi:hypothetical protein